MGLIMERNDRTTQLLSVTRTKNVCFSFLIKLH